MPAWCDEKWKLERHLQLAVAAERFEALAQQLAVVGTSELEAGYTALSEDPDWIESHAARRRLRTSETS